MTPRAALVAALLSALAAAAPARADQGASGGLEYPIKAAFLYKFGGFVGWPASAFDGPGAPMTVCVVGRDPFGSTLDEAVRGKTAGDRRVVVRRLETIDASSACHVAYLAGSPRQSVGTALAAVAGAPILTVTDEDRGAARGMVHFVTTGGRVRFHIDQRAAATGRVAISSKLMNLALSVRTAS